MDRVGEVTEPRATVWRWREAFQNAFRARMEWCVRERANHAPTAVLNGDGTRRVLRLRAAPGQPVRLDAAGSKDPDGDALDYRWFHYAEPGGFADALDLGEAGRASVAFTIPRGEAREVHIVLEVRDRGTPPLVSYRRAIIEPLCCASSAVQ